MSKLGERWRAVCSNGHIEEHERRKDYSFCVCGALVGWESVAPPDPERAPDMRERVAEIVRQTLVEYDTEIHGHEISKPAYYRGTAAFAADRILAALAPKLSLEEPGEEGKPEVELPTESEDRTRKP